MVEYGGDSRTEGREWRDGRRLSLDSTVAAGEENESHKTAKLLNVGNMLLLKVEDLLSTMSLSVGGN